MYNTKLIGIEQTNFDFAILRTLGIYQGNILYIVVSSGIFLVLIACFCGYLLAELFLPIISSALG